MPRLSIWTIRMSLLYLLAGATIGVFVLADKGIGAYPASWHWFGAHQEFLLFGWLGQFAMGIGYWAFPRYRGNHRGNPTLAGAAVVLLNAGILLVFASTFWGWTSILWGRALESAAALSFACYAWPRIKPTGA